MRNLTEGNEAKLIIAFAIPLLIGNVFQQLYSTVDAIIVGIDVGKEALAAVGVSFPIVFLMISIIMGISMGGGILLSQYFGAKDHTRLRKAMHTMYVFLFIASIVTTAVGIVIADPVLRLIGTPEAYLKQAEAFLQITFAGMVFVFGYNAISAVLRSLGDSKNPLYFLIISSAINIGLVALFVLVFHWGIAGSAWATVVAQAIAFVISLIYIQKSKDALVRISLAEFKIDREELRKIFKLGLPGAVQMGLVSLSFIALNAIVNPFGTDVMAGYTAATRLDSFAVLPAMNLSMAIATFVGQNMGAGKPERVKRGLNATLLISGAISVAITLIFTLFPHQLVAWFADDPSVVSHGAEYLIVVSLFYVVFSFMFVYMGVLRGSGAATFAMIATVVAVWAARVPASWILSQFFGPVGIWWGIPIGWGFGTAMVMIYYATGRWKNKVLVRGPGNGPGGQQTKPVEQNQAKPEMVPPAPGEPA